MLKSKIHILPNYEQTDPKTAIVVPEIFSSRMKISEALNGLGEMNMLKSKATSPEVSLLWACKTDINS